jgi:hypothetical protein
MPDTLESNVRLFADDTIVYLTISALTDCHTLQSGLHKLEKWVHLIEGFGKIHNGYICLFTTSHAIKNKCLIEVIGLPVKKCDP